MHLKFKLCNTDKIFFSYFQVTLANLIKIKVLLKNLKFQTHKSFKFTIGN